MTAEEYQLAVRMVWNSARTLLLFDIPKLLEDIERADVIAPLIDPTLYLQKKADMEVDRAVLRAALPLWKHAKAIKEQGVPNG